MSPDKNTDIKLLWKTFLNGDEKAFTDIYYLFIDALWSYGNKLSSDREMINDSLQEIFLDVYQKRSKSHIPLENPKAYLFVALKNSILKKILKNRKINAKMHDTDYLDSFNIEYDFKEKLLDNEVSEESHARLHKALQTLSPGQKEIIFLKFEEGFSYKEISSILKISVESARTQVYRALVSLREILNKKDFLITLLVFSYLKRGRIDYGIN